MGTEACVELLAGAPGQQLFCIAADEDQGRILLDDVKEKLVRGGYLKAGAALFGGDQLISKPSWATANRSIGSDQLSLHQPRTAWCSASSAGFAGATCFWGMLDRAVEAPVDWLLYSPREDVGGRHLDDHRVRLVERRLVRVLRVLAVEEGAGLPEARTLLDERRRPLHHDALARSVRAPGAWPRRRPRCPGSPRCT